MGQNLDRTERTKLRRLQLAIRRNWEHLHPGRSVRRGSAVGVVTVIVALAVHFGIFLRPGLPGILDSVAGVVVYLGLAAFMGLVFWLSYRLLLVLPRFFNTLGLMALLVLVYFLSDMGFPPPFNLLLGIGFGLAAALLGGGLAHLFDREFRFYRGWKKGYTVLSIGIPLCLLILVLVWIVDRGTDVHLVGPSPVGANVEALTAPNPGRPGPYRVLSLTYGSGDNPRRPEFGSQAVLKTSSVDATPFVKNNQGWKIKLRHWYWGFNFEAFPINGTVWYPDGRGPFPLVLIVHGNHKMQEYSDPGYAYLGELLASRGFVFVSVDENFFNGAFMSGLSKENDGRAWMLLQHLTVWRTWNQDPDSVFFHKVDMDRIGLIGHSRGGEAAAIAGAFNRLRFYPDDATVSFDFGFNIHAVIAIAPSDGQYKPTGRPNPLDNVNYLVVQGAHDSDVSIFAGDRQYNRVRFTDDGYWFKASLYSYRSNHGQFNTVWGDSDWGRPMGVILNREPLLSGEEQRTIAKVYFSAFLEATLHGNAAYIPMFRDHRLIADWLPEDVYISRFQDSTFRALCDYEEDVDVTTGTSPGTVITQKNLAVWREADLATRSSRSTKQNNVVFVGWRGADDVRQGEAAPFYCINLPDSLPNEFGVDRDSMLVFALAEVDEKVPDPVEDQEGSDPASSQDLKYGNKTSGQTKSESGDETKEPLELSIELIDAGGHRVLFPLDRFRPVPPVTKSRFTKVMNEGKIFGKEYEPTLQTFELPMSEFVAASQAFKPEEIRLIQFIFDRGREGVLAIDQIGLAKIRKE